MNAIFRDPSWWATHGQLKIARLANPDEENLRCLLQGARNHDHFFVSTAEVLYRELPWDCTPVLVTFAAAQQSHETSIRWLIDRGVACLVHARPFQCIHEDQKWMTPKTIQSLGSHPLVQFGVDGRIAESMSDSTVKDWAIERELLGSWIGKPPETLAMNLERDLHVTSSLAAQAGFSALFSPAVKSAYLPLPKSERQVLCLPLESA